MASSIGILAEPSTRRTSGTSRLRVTPVTSWDWSGWC